jgi:hypothetical protein
MGEFILLLFFAGIDVYYFAETFTYRKPLFETTGGPAVYPRLILALLFFFLVIRAIQVWRTAKKPPFVFFDLFKGSCGVFLYSFFVYILLMQPLGYVIATLLYLTFISHYLLYHKNGTIGTIRLAGLRIVVFAMISFLLYQFFAVILNVNMPAGMLEFFR